MTLPCRVTWAVLTTAITVAGLSVRAQEASTAAPTGPVLTNHPTLQESVDRLFARSAAWRSAMKSVDDLRRRVVVVTPRHVRVKDPRSGKVTTFDDDVLAEVQPLAEVETRVDAVVVVVNLDLLHRLHGASTTFVDFQNDLDRVLAHEVYGHAVPYLLAGDLSGKCADPARGQRVEDACAIKRENEIRAEMRLGKRREYGVDSLAAARRDRH
jgi:hypothetical protein